MTKSDAEILALLKSKGADAKTVGRFERSAARRLVASARADRHQATGDRAAQNRADVADLLRQGVPKAEIARRFGLVPSYISQLAKRASGAPAGHRFRSVAAVENMVRVAALVGEGLSNAEIGRRLGLSRGYVGELRKSAEGKAR